MQKQIPSSIRHLALTINYGGTFYPLVMSSPLSKFWTRVVSQTGQKPTGSVLFLHGSGDTGIGIQTWIESVLDGGLNFPHLRVLYPTAPPRPYTPMMGQLSTVWYDRKQISPSAADDETVDRMAAQLTELIQSEVNEGIPLDRIILGGFSMGGGMALHLGYRFLRDVAGVFALSSFLSNDSKVYKALQDPQPGPIPRLFQSHGELDELVLYPWGKETHARLTSMCVPGVFHSVPGLHHELDRNTLLKLRDWINETLPPDS